MPKDSKSREWLAFPTILLCNCMFVSYNLVPRKGWFRLRCPFERDDFKASPPWQKRAFYAIPLLTPFEVGLPCHVECLDLWCHVSLSGRRQHANELHDSGWELKKNDTRSKAKCSKWFFSSGDFVFNAHFQSSITNMSIFVGKDSAWFWDVLGGFKVLSLAPVNA